MGKIMVLARRELAAYFFSPVAYIVIAMFLALASIAFFWSIPIVPDSEPIFEAGREATLGPLFNTMAFLLVAAAPLLTMRLMSEEYNTGTVEPLMTAPVTDTQVILGKFLGVMIFYLILLACTVIFLILMSHYGQPDVGVVFTGYLGMILLGAAYLSVGLFTSTVTRHQLVAAIYAILILGFFGIALQLVSLYTGDPWRSLAGKLNTMQQFKLFSIGKIDPRAVVFFVTTTITFLFFSVKTLESKRWR